MCVTYCLTECIGNTFSLPGLPKRIKWEDSGWGVWLSLHLLGAQTHSSQRLVWGTFPDGGISPFPSFHAATCPISSVMSHPSCSAVGLEPRLSLPRCCLLASAVLFFHLGSITAFEHFSLLCSYSFAMNGNTSNIFSVEMRPWWFLWY